MTLQEKIQNDLKQAMLEKNDDVKSILRVVLAEFARGKFQTIDDNDAIKIIKRMSIETLELGNIVESEILSRYLPQMLSSEQLEESIDLIMLENNYNEKKDMGKIMSSLKQKHGSLYDGKLASEIVNKKLK